jgi:hypothetical protein
MIMEPSFEEKFLQALSDVPEMPDCYTGVMKRIKRRNAIRALGWSAAASLLIAASSFLYTSRVHSSAVPMEVVEELQSIQNHVNGEDVHQELVSYSLVSEEIYK